MSESFKPHPESLERGSAVTEPSALFYLLAVADLDQDGDRVVTFVYSKNRIMRVELVVQGTTEIEVDYTEITDAGERNVEGRQEVVRIRLDGITGGRAGQRGGLRVSQFAGRRGDLSGTESAGYRYRSAARFDTLAKATSDCSACA